MPSVGAVTLVTWTLRAFHSGMSSVAEVLRGLPFLEGVSPAVIERLAARCVPRSVGEGFTLFRAGERCTGVYVVLEGRVRIYRTSSDGREQTLTMEGAGRPVAEMPLFDGGNYPATAVTMVPSRLAFLPKADFEHAFRTDPDVASAIVRALGRRLRHFVSLVETLAFRDVAARLAMRLADYADRYGVADGDEVEIDLDRTHEDIAAEIGTARESVSRSIKQLKGKGLVLAVDGNRWRVVPAPRLRAWARGED